MTRPQAVLGGRGGGDALSMHIRLVARPFAARLGGQSQLLASASHTTVARVAITSAPHGCITGGAVTKTKGHFAPFRPL